MRIRFRASRKCGELLDFYDARGGDRKSGDFKKAGSDRFDLTKQEIGKQAGLSDRQIKTNTRLAKIPESEFEKAIMSDVPPSICYKKNILFRINSVCCKNSRKDFIPIMENSPE